MAHLFHLPNLREGYVELVDTVWKYGRQASPRDQLTYELEDVTFTVEDLRDTLPLGVGRQINVLIGVLEALQLIAGRARSDLLCNVAPAFSAFNEPGTEQHYGAYGARVGTQLGSVVHKLKSDEHSRQAVITLWDRDLDNEPGHLDYPCTLTLGFRLRQDKLNLSVTMRSNDVWLGTAYDVFQFTQLQATVAQLLGVETGTYAHTAWSLHLYDLHLGLAEKLAVEPKMGRPLLPEGIDPSLARDLLRGDLIPTRTFSEEWYSAQMLRVWDKRRV